MSSQPTPPPPRKKKNDPELDMSGKEPPPWRVLVAYGLFMFFIVWAWQSSVQDLAVKSIPYSEFKQHLAAGEVKSVAVEEFHIRGLLRTAEGDSETKESPPPENPDPSVDKAEDLTAFRSVRVEDPDLIKQLEEAGVDYAGMRPNPLSQFFTGWILPIAILIAIWMFIASRMSRSAGGMLGIGKSRARLITSEETGVTFDDVAGCDEAKFELEEVVDLLRDPGRYQELGARIPKGVLLVGPPGTGKTLLARAVAGEAGTPFFSLSGSDFVEMFVGVGSARVRDLFDNAKKHAPCLIFIDELDAIGRQRGVHVGAVNDEREQTLNQLLVEMDGFDANAGVILLAATNRPDVLDRALLRPGRFDRQVVVDAPDAEGREAILKVHSRGKRLHEDVDLAKMARATAGMTGADLANALNEAALLAARREAKSIQQKDLEEAIEKVVAGPERKSRRLNEDDKRRVAYHEVGHALVAAKSKGADPVHKISIVPRGKAALGYTMQLPDEDQFLLSEQELLARIRSLLGGRAAEKVVFGDITTGAQNDLERATALARQMVCQFGMSEKIGLSAIARPENTYLRDGGPTPLDCSDETAREADEEVKKILDVCYRETIDLLERYRDKLDEISIELLEKENMDGRRFYELIDATAPDAIETE